MTTWSDEAEEGSIVGTLPSRQAGLPARLSAPVSVSVSEAIRC